MMGNTRFLFYSGLLEEIEATARPADGPAVVEHMTMRMVTFPDRPL